MKLYRYCGQNEVDALLNGEVLTSVIDWSEKYDTNSKGFCFFAYNRTNDMRKIITQSLEDWLGGIVKADYIVEIDVDSAKKSYGFYACGRRTEYNLASYSLKNVKAISKVVKLSVDKWLIEGDYFYRYDAEKIF